MPAGQASDSLQRWSDTGLGVPASVVRSFPFHTGGEGVQPPHPRSRPAGEGGARGLLEAETLVFLPTALLPLSLK